jgi:DNA-binding response OmpR family regulator
MISSTILMIDDDPAVLNGIGMVLRREWDTVLVAPDGATGLRLLREHPVQVVLLDLQMPGLDGFAVI